MNLNELRDQAHNNAKARGFYDKGQPSVGDFCANLHGEVSELWEAHRHDQLEAPCDKATAMILAGCVPLSCAQEELADIIIRALDMAGALGIDLDEAVCQKMKFNATRSYRHGGKIA